MLDGGSKVQSLLVPARFFRNFGLKSDKYEDAACSPRDSNHFNLQLEDGRWWILDGG